MAATETLATVTLLSTMDAQEASLLLSSTTGIFPGVRLFVDRELMQVIGIGVGNNVNVRRGVDGSAAAPHVNNSTMYYGRASQFYQSNPLGRPTDAVLVTPYINVVNGTVWLPQGDNHPPG